MAITFVNKGTWAAGTTSISPGIPASMQAGDFMLLQVHTCNQAVSAITGWTAVTGSPVSTGTANTAGGTRISAYYRWWQSGDAAPTVAVTGGTVTNGIITGYRGVDATTPFDATPVATTLATANTSLVMTGITTATANALIHWAIARDQDLNSTTAVTAYTNANLTGITEVHDQVVNTGVGGGIWTGYGFKATAGATGNTTITQTSSIAVGLTIALRPAPNNYKLTCTGGAYSLTGGSANITYVNPARPVIISATALNLGLSASPGAQSVTVPTDAQIAVVMARNSRTGRATLSLSSTFGTFTLTNVNDTIDDTVSTAYCVVTATGSQTITPTWSASLAQGPLFTVTFIKNVNTSDYLRSIDSVVLNSSSTAATRTVNSSTNDLVLALDSQYDLAETPPALGAAYATVLTTGFTDEGGRLVTVNSPGSTTTTVTGQSISYNGLSVVSIKPNVSGVYTLTANGGSYSLTGGTATLKRDKKIVASGGNYSLTGQQAVITWSAASNAYTLTALGGSYAITGASAVVSRNKTLTASGGSYSVVGSSAGVLRTKRITASGGSYTVSGGTASLLRSKRIVASGGAYTYTGSNATVLKAKVIVASGGSYTVSGQQATVLRSKVLVASGGTYTYTGQQITITYVSGSINYLLTALGGSYSVTGSNAVLSRNRSLSVGSGVYSISGSNAVINRNRTLTTTGGIYTLSGSTASLLRSKYIVASGGSYGISGSSVSLSKNRTLTASGGTYTLVGQPITITWATVGGAVWPSPGLVLLGTTYGPTGTEYTGTLDILGVKYDITTGNIIKPISNKVVMSL